MFIQQTGSNGVPVVLRKVVAALACTLAMTLLACLPAQPPRTAQAQTTAGTASGFQRHLDRHGVNFRVPQTGKAILVNIPAFELIAFEDGEPAFRSPVIVGSTRHRTPRIETYVTAVRFRPTWRPTPSMIASGEYRDRLWPPGRRNPLGLAAIRLEPGLLVYLHDTNRRKLFDRPFRALSHGCIRVKKWDTRAGWVLDMSLDEVHANANGRRTFDAPAPQIPVKLGYFTRFPDDDGFLIVHDDVYNLGDDAEGQASGDAPGTCAPP